MLLRRHGSAVLVVGVLVLTACWDDPATTADTDTTPTTATSSPDVTGSPTSGPPTTAASTADLPDIDVVALASGDPVALRSLATPGRPSLLWFWAPHCTICRREAPELLAFTAEHAGEIDVLGLGAQDSLDEAYGFLDDTDTHDLTMVWDETGQSWVHHGVTSQPTIVVLDRDGQVAGRWYRDFDEDGILAAAGLG
jgi:thiol-disulfide isomerase/thioredoxin